MDPESIYGYNSMSTEIDPLLVRHVPKQESKKGTSWLAGGVFLANITIGMGLLNYPKAIKDSGGIISSLVIEVFCLTMVVTGLFLLMYTARECKAGSLQEIMKSCYGTRAMNISSFLIVILNLGACTVLLIALGDQINKGMEIVSGPEYCLQWYMSRTFTLTVTSIVLILPLCFPKNFDVFKYTSCIGAVAILYMVVLVVTKYIMMRKTEYLPKQYPLWHGSRNWMQMVGFIPTVLFNFDGCIEAVLLYNTLKRRSFLYYGLTIATSLSLVTFIFTSVGVFGYLTFGEVIADDVLLSYDAHDIMASIAAVIIAVKLITAFPPLMYCVRTALEDLCLKHCMSKHEFLRRIVLTTILFMICLTIALIVPEIGEVVALLGGFSAVFIFIFPGLCFIRVTLFETAGCEKYTIATYIKFIFSIFFIVMGVFVFGYSTTRSVYGYIESAQAPTSANSNPC